jgi:hypothetical protein
LLGGLVSGAAALVACAGCEAQVGEGYRGEAILTLQGSVELGDGAAADLVPVLAFRTEAGYVLVDTHVEGEFPAHFRLSVFDPPPLAATKLELGVSPGILTVMPRNHPSELPLVGQFSVPTPQEDGTTAVKQDFCTASKEICWHRDLVCVARECPVVGETGSPISSDQVASVGREGMFGAEHSLVFDEECNAEHECHRVFRKCDLPPYWLDSFNFASGTMGTCQVRSESGDSRAKLYESVRRSAVGYFVMYAPEAVSSLEMGPVAYGPVRAGYSVYRVVEPASDQDWIDSITCQRDTPESSDCPVGAHVELVSPDEQLKLKLGFGVTGP